MWTIATLRKSDYWVMVVKKSYCIYKKVFEVVKYHCENREFIKEEGKHPVIGDCKDLINNTSGGGAGATAAVT